MTFQTSFHRHPHPAIAFFAFVASTCVVAPVRGQPITGIDNEINYILTTLSDRIIQEGGHVHPNLKLVSPAPCVAERGVIFAKEETNNNDDKKTGEDETTNDIWLRVPFSYQLTRDLALETLTPLIPPEVLAEAPLVTLDDAALLVLLLVHLRGLGDEGDDKWQPYLASLPDNPGCGWWGDDTRRGYEQLIPKQAIASSQKYVARVSNGMARDYGPSLAHKYWPTEWRDDGTVIGETHTLVDSWTASAARALEWSLCIVSSRGTAASPTHGGGSVRLVPLADMFNHNLHSDGFTEVMDRGAGMRQDLVGSFEVHRHKEVQGEEITVDYNLWGYSPEDWFLSHGFVPSEVLDSKSSMAKDL